MNLPKDPPNRRASAVQAFQSRQAEIDRNTAAEKEKIAADAHRQNVFRMDWLTKGGSLIPNAVMAVSNQFAGEGSLLLFAPLPPPSTMVRRTRTGHLVTPVPPVIFDVRQSGSLESRGQLRFKADLITGKVHVSCSGGGVTLPAPIDISALTTQWVSQVAETVLIAALEGRIDQSRNTHDDDSNLVPED